MGSRKDERERQVGDGLGLNLARARIALMLGAVAALGFGLAGGLARMGWPIEAGDSAARHGALMVSGFLGTVIAIERATALRSSSALLAPLASAFGTFAMLAGFATAGHALWIVAPAVMVVVGIAIVRKQSLPHTWLLLAATFAWGFGNVAYAAGRLEIAIAWWFTFLVSTIAAERLELTRLMRRRPAANRAFVGVMVLVWCGAALVAFEARAGGVLFGLSLAALAAWLARFDIARRTVKMAGFARYAAWCLLGGYAWLAVGGVALAAVPLGHAAAYDIALHAIALGFVVSMIFGHAPVIVPAVTGVRSDFAPAFYGPLAMLHLSLVARFLGGDASRWGALGNAAAIAVFAVTLLSRRRRL